MIFSYSSFFLSLADTERKVHKETASLNMLLLDPGCNPSVEECKEVIRHLLFISKQQREEVIMAFFLTLAQNYMFMCFFFIILVGPAER